MPKRIYVDPLTCGGPCEHSDEDHMAFDRGACVGAAGGGADENPYRIARSDGPSNPFWAEAWASGYSAGRLQHLKEIK